MNQRIFDSHAHAFPDAVAPAAIKKLLEEPFWIKVNAYHDGTVNGLLATMDRAGIEKSILCSVATKPSQVKKITDWSAAIASDRIIPFASIHPDFDQPEAEIERIASLGLRGLKFHPQYMNCAADDPRTLRIARAAAAVGLTMTFHAGYDPAFEKDELASPRQIRWLHDQVPNLRLQACHLGGWERWGEALEYLAGCPIYLETSFSLTQCPPDLLERILHKHPKDYLLFGTDSPWADQKAELQALASLQLPPDLLRAMLWDNALRLVGQAG